MLSLDKHRSTFSVRSSSDADIPYIWDMELLPGDLVVLADSRNKCVKLYDSQVRISVFKPTLYVSPKRNKL